MSPHICIVHDQRHRPFTAEQQAYRHRRIHAHHVALLNKQLPRLVAHLAHLRLRYGSTCSKLFNVPATCQELARAPLVACARTCPGHSYSQPRLAALQWYFPTFTLALFCFSRMHSEGRCRMSRLVWLWQDLQKIKGSAGVEKAPAQRLVESVLHVC